MKRLRYLGPNAMLGLAMLCTPASTSADVLSPPPDDCPLGSIPVECHGPSRCRPGSCEPGGCAPGQACSEIALCIETINCGGMSYDPQDSVLGPCDAGGGCPEFTECRPVMACLPQDDATATLGASSASGGSGTGGGAVDRGCSCTTRAVGPGFGVLPWLLLGVGLRRRR